MRSVPKTGPRQSLTAVRNALLLVSPTSPPFLSVILFSQLKYVEATSRLNTSPKQKRVKKREKTVVLEAENHLEETPVETRGGPWGPVGARAPY